MNLSQLSEAMEPEIRKAVTDLIANNVSAMALELNDSPEGKLKVSLGFTLSLVNTKLYTIGTLAYSRKFSDEIQSSCDIEDFENPKLPGIGGTSMSIKVGDNEPVNLSLSQLKSAAARVAAHKERAE